MANKRMFSKRITNSARFLKMPVSSQTLYFHLNMNADDDGIVEAYNILRLSNSSEDDLRVLMAKKFVRILNDEDMITHIIDWDEHNFIRADRKVDSIYKNLLLQIEPDIKLIEAKSRADTGIPTKQHVDTGLTLDSERTAQIRLDKIRLDKDSIDIVSGKDIKSDKSDTKNTYGEYKNIKLTEIEYKKLKEKYNNTDYLINFLSAYKVEKAYKTRSDYLTILRWVADAVNKKKQQSAPVKQEKKYDYKENKLDFTGAFKNAE